MSSIDAIRVYGADWCGDCHRATRMLRQHEKDFEWIDVDADPHARAEAVRLAGRRNIPVIVFPEGTVLVEPTDPELEKTLVTTSA